MDDPLEERGKIIEKILQHMNESEYKDESIYLTLKAQTELHKISTFPKNCIKNIKEKIKNTDEFSTMFDEIELIQSKTGDICCITQNKIEERWENQCGHVYEKKALLAYQKQKIVRNRCPAAGCSAIIKEKN